MAVLCCTVVSFMGTDALKNIPVIKSAYYDTVVANWPQFVDFLSADIGKAIFSVALLAICMCYLFRWLYRPFATLIAHSTMGHNLSLLHESLKKSFWFVRRCIDVQLPSKNASEDQIVAAICAQDELFKKIRERNWCSTVFYYGVAHTPLVFRLKLVFNRILLRSGPYTAGFSVGLSMGTDYENSFSASFSINGG